MERRSFIQRTAVGSVALAAGLPYKSTAQTRRLKIGLIGCGWYGMVDINAALKVGGVEVIALCDVDSEHLKSSADEIEKLQGSRPKEFKHYQELLDVKGLEALFIGTPPHWHALQFIAACKKGLDIYCEKPICYDVSEGIAMMKAAETAGNIVQIGFQRRQNNAFKKTKELIENGTTGKIHQVAAQIHFRLTPADSTIQAPPASLDWEEWCGPAPKLDYRPSIGHKTWRLEKAYGNGHLVDWGIHHIDIVRKTLNLGMPVSFSAIGDLKVFNGKITTPDTLNAIMNFEQCSLIWQHRLWGTGDINEQYNNGVFFYGEKATIFTSENKVIIFPAGSNQKQEEMSIPTPDMREKHVSDFLNAVKAKDKSLLSCTIQDAFQSTATVQLAMNSYYTKSDIKWDAVKRVIINNEEASKLLARPYRGNYKRPS